MYHILCLLFNYVLYMISPQISQTEYNHENVANSYGISDYLYYTGYWELMSVHMLLNALLPPQRSIHMNSSKYKGSWCLWHPFMCLIFLFTWFQKPSTLFVWMPVTGSTKWREWLTTACDVMFGRFVIVSYAAHSSVWTTVLGRVCCWIIPCNVTRSLDCTISM